MNFKFAGALAGLVLALIPASVSAGDYAHGSVKDAGGPAGVPVPAPVPIPVFRADYYIRADVGLGLNDSMSASEQGLVYGQDAAGDVTVPGAWIDGDGTLPMTFGVGVGRYWSDHFRTDLTIDWMRQDAALIEGNLTYIRASDGAEITVATNDKTTREGGIFLANAYFDFGGAQRRFAPYIGAGIGFALTSLDRNHQTVEQTCNAPPCAAGTYDAVGSYTADNKSNVISLAAAAMVGFTYDIGNSMLLDLNYRYLHVGGSDSSLNVFNSHSTLNVDSTNDHQLRAGVRVNID